MLLLQKGSQKKLFNFIEEKHDPEINASVMVKSEKWWKQVTS